MRKLLGTALAVGIAGAGVVGLIAFFNSRDDSTTGAGRSAEPAERSVRARPGAGAGLLKDGNVVLEYGDPALTPRLRALAEGLGAPDRPELRAAGQAVVLRFTGRAAGIRAVAHSRELVVRDARDMRLQAFVERWLGQGPAG